MRRELALLAALCACAVGGCDRLEQRFAPRPEPGYEIVAKDYNFWKGGPVTSCRASGPGLLECIERASGGKEVSSGLYLIAPEERVEALRRTVRAHGQDDISSGTVPIAHDLGNDVTATLTYAAESPLGPPHAPWVLLPAAQAFLQGSTKKLDDRVFSDADFVATDLVKALVIYGATPPFDIRSAHMDGRKLAIMGLTSDGGAISIKACTFDRVYWHIVVQDRGEADPKTGKC
jgi:hypothetical protein